MPALPADIIRATRAARVVSISDSAILSAHPNARDMGDSPQPGYFESASDATAALELAQDLLGTFRRRFLVTVHDDVEVDPLTEIPTFQLIDAEQAIDGPALLTRFEIDDETETTSLEVLV